MPASPLDSAIYRDLFGDAETARLFTDSAEIRAMMLVEGALAKVQGELGLIPDTAAEAIHRAAHQLQIDPAELAEATGRNGVPVPALVEAFRAAMRAPEHAPFLHWGATSQDIIDTAAALRLRQALAIFEERLKSLAARLGSLAEAHADTPMLARTYGQAAVPTSFGAVVAGWGAPLLRHLERLSTVRSDVALVSMAGAGGTLSAMDRGAEVRAALARALGLHDPGGSRHATRDGVAGLAAWCAGVTGSLAKMGDDLVFLTATGIGEVRLGDAGASSTMPQKANPVGPSALVALAGLVAPLAQSVHAALVHPHQRDGGAWFTEWLALPQSVIATGSALATALRVVDDLSPDTEAMARNIDATGGAVFAEALSFALARRMSRPEAQEAVKALLARAASETRPLAEVAAETHPEIDLDGIFDPARQLGEAPAEARAFAMAAAAHRK